MHNTNKITPLEKADISYGGKAYGLAFLKPTIFQFHMDLLYIQNMLLKLLTTLLIVKQIFQN